MKREELQRERMEDMQAALDSAGIIYFEYYPETDTAIEFNKRDLFDLEEHLENYPECWFEKGFTHPEDVELLRNAFHKMKEGAKQQICDVRNRMNGTYHWHHYIFTSIYKEDGTRSKVLATAQDITQQKEIERRIAEERRYQDEISGENLISKMRCNLTGNYIERYESISPIQNTEEGAEYDRAVYQFLQMNCMEGERDYVGEMLSKEHMVKELEEGRDKISFEYRRKMTNGRYIWTNVIIRIYRDPISDDVMCFLYSYDIENEKILETIVRKISELDYEVLALLNIKEDRLETVRVGMTDGRMGAGDECGYKESIEKFVDYCFDEESKEEAKRSFQTENLVRQLERDGVYTIAYTISANGESYRKKWEFAWLDDQKNVIIFSRADITDLFNQQEQQKEDLRNALLQAEEASHAKSSFLSRMSHEIRTPMNAIIGMTALAVQNIDSQEQVQDCLAKVGISARFLLSLINDILDMSRIESGKVSVKHEKFPFEELVNSVNTIIYDQAIRKGLDYECVLTSFTTPYYYGDSMKLQQILVNLLGNAVKFTPAGGRIQMMIRQERTENGNAHMVFTINDTGIGIGEDFQKRIFEPFEQGDNTITTPYRGTGLGLAICKNLINMMGGTISVNSIIGVGSEFTVKLKLGVCEEELPYQKLSLPLELDKLQTLIVDDDITVCEHTQDLLKDMGMKAEWVESGRKAVETVKIRWNKKQYFDVILVDWKMPDMNGIETTREIRKIVGPDVTIIVMTAYDWADIEHEAKMAGVNLLVSKPLFKSSLVSVFEKIYSDKEQQKEEHTKKEYDFTNQHVLLVEDHILNIEVAKRLLQAKGAIVDVAENGLQAIEAFTEAEDGYFDAVLMDIRMPIMDGLTAARSIRQLRKASAKLVPIIAMSANAFDEDIEKSKAAGMNEHLSKPIEPEILYAVLDKEFNKTIKGEGHE